MFEYKSMPLDKDSVLMKNGIVGIIRKDDEDGFIQYNDYFEHKTFFQCPRCKSLNVQIDNLQIGDTLLDNTKQCLDCGYLSRTRFKEDNND
ncbi:hypothetical protein [Staphylococcus haemolyticus]|uniref:hypothetical protein n=2 Tax=Staphylococcus haemolyticus TaxID=1283 RepID=UPI001F21C4AA|nr:hypothetical protein [Staphylococcus haemolyticus]